MLRMYTVAVRNNWLQSAGRESNKLRGVSQPIGGQTAGTNSEFNYVRGVLAAGEYCTKYFIASCTNTLVFQRSDKGNCQSG